MAVKLVTEQTKTLTSGRFSDSLAPPSILTKDTTIGELPAHRYQVGVNTVVAQVEKTLRLYPILPGVIVTQHDRMVNVISRRRFFEILGTRYGVAVFLKRPIEIMIRHVEEPLILPGTCLIDEAVHEALQRETILAYEPILVDFQAHGFQLLDIYTLLLAQSQLFATLQQELQTINVDLEDRVARRTEELTRVKNEAIRANQFKTELMAKVNHELRTPLGAIMGYTQLLQMGAYGPTAPEQTDPLELILSSTNSLSTLVNSLLDQAQLEKGNLTLENRPFSVREMASEVDPKVRILAEKTGLTFKILIEPSFPEEIVGDRMRIEQIWTNLLSNAIKFTEQGYIHTHIRLQGTGQWLIEVADTGIGIPEEVQASIFDTFVQVDGSATRNHSGAGLGLSIAASIIELMGGTIDLESTLGQGTTFTVILPLNRVDKE